MCCQLSVRYYQPFFSPKVWGIEPLTSEVGCKCVTTFNQIVDGVSCLKGCTFLPKILVDCNILVFLYLAGCTLLQKIGFDCNIFAA